MAVEVSDAASKVEVSDAASGIRIPAELAWKGNELKLMIVAQVFFLCVSPRGIPVWGAGMLNVS